MKGRAKRIDTEPRSGGILLATGVSRWNVTDHDQPHSGDRVNLPRLRRSLSQRPVLHRLSPVAIKMPPLRGSMWTALLRAVSASVLIMLSGSTIHLLAQSKQVPAADVNHRDPDGSTPLQWAVYDGNVSEVQRLLKAGANVSLANNYGASPMSLAAEVGNADILKLLLDAGANADSPNPEGQTALMAVARTGNVKAAQLGVCTPAPGDDESPDCEGRQCRRPLDESRLSAARDGRGASQKSGHWRTHAVAVCRA
jgi:hypothetical protein